MRTLLSAVLLLLSCVAIGQAPCPLIKGETTEGKFVELPAAAAGKYAIVAIAAGKKAEPVLQEWYEPAYLRFVAKQGLFAGAHDADLWLVPIFTGLNKAAFGPSIKRLKEQADPDVAKRVVFVKEDSGALIDALGIKDREEPLFLVVDPQGRIIHRERGAYTVDKLDALEQAMDR
jgi:hypothetical protein